MRRGLLLDRDGVINRDGGYVGHVEDFVFMPGLFPFLRAAQEYGFRLAILTNQSGVARGRYNESDYERLTEWMLGALRCEGVEIDLMLNCYEHPEGVVAPYGRESFWRKPNPGMVLEAIQRLHLDPMRSAFLGDQPRDMEAAAAGGIGKKLFLSSEPVPAGAIQVRDFDQAMAELLSLCH